MQPVLELNINKASLKHNLHVSVPGLDFFFFQFKLICGFRFLFSKSVLVLKVKPGVGIGNIFL